MRKAMLACLAAICGTTTLPASAVDNGFYFGAAIGQAGVDLEDEIEGSSFDYDASSTGFKVIAGWRFFDWLAVEGNYVDLGSGDDRVFGEKLETDVDGVSLSAVGFVPVGPVDLFARIGVINWNAELSAPSLDLDVSDDGTDLAYGVGAQFRVWSLSLRAEYERFDISDANTIDLVSLGVTWTFL